MFLQHDNWPPCSCLSVLSVCNAHFSVYVRERSKNSHHSCVLRKSASHHNFKIKYTFAVYKESLYVIRHVRHVCLSVHQFLQLTTHTNHVQYQPPHSVPPISKFNFGLVHYIFHDDLLSTHFSSSMEEHCQFMQDLGSIPGWNGAHQW